MIMNVMRRPMNVGSSALIHQDHMNAAVKQGGDSMTTMDKLATVNHNNHQ